MVRMCSARVSLIRSMIAASVVDLPDPVGPVTSTMPLFRAAVSDTALGRLSSAIVGMVGAMTRITIAKVPRWRKTLTRKRARSGIAYEKSQAPWSLSVASACAFCPIRSLAMRDVSSGASRGRLGTSTGTSSPCRSTCGGRDGEKMRSLMPLPESSMAMISAGVARGTGFGLSIGCRQRVSRNFCTRLPS